MGKQIFISYSHSDINVVLWLKEELKRHGYHAWVDSNSIKVGQIWREEIVQGIESSDYFMIILSPRSVHSINVVKELSLAESSGKTILPVLIEDVEIPPKMKYQLAGVQFIVLDRQNGAENIDLLINGLKNQAIGVGTSFLSQPMQKRGYVVQDCISKFGMDKTFRIEDVDRGRLAVLKVFHAPEALINQFIAESKRLELLRQQGIPLILDHFSSEGFYFLVQEYIQGTPWSEVKWTPELITTQARKILLLLSSMHERGIVHNDIRPHNLLYDPETNESSIIDLSLSQTSLHLNETISQSKGSLSREYYRAPELVRFSLLSPASDLYAFGVTVLTLMSGEPPDSLYQKERGCWSMSRVDSSTHSWLAPLLLDSSSERVKSAKEVITLMDLGDSPAVYPVRTSSQITTRSNLVWNRKALIDCLALSIGPIAENLLQDYKENLDSLDQQTIRIECEEKGIDLGILDECFLQAQQTSEKALSGETSPKAFTDGNPISADVLPWLVNKIGPAARLFWDNQMIEALLHSPTDARLRLESMGVPTDVIVELLAKVSSQPSNHRLPEETKKETSSPTIHPSISEKEPPISAVSFSETNLKEILVREIGPMAISLHDTYKSESDLQTRANIILERLTQLGISEDSLQRLRDKLLNWQ